MEPYDRIYHCRGELRTTAEYVRAYGGASVAVNLHHGLGSNGLSYAYCNQRVFELASMGVPQVVDARADLPKYFEIGKEIVTFSDAGELKSKVEELLRSPPQAEEIGLAARRRVLDQHTHMHRAQMLLESIGMLSAQKPVGQESVAD